MKLNKLLTRLVLLGAVATLMAGCCVPYGPRGHYHYNGHDNWGQRGR